jgi:hypothetical protein
MQMRYLLIAVASAGLAVAGCGSDADGGSSAVGSAASATSANDAGASRQEFIDQANSLCAKRSAELAVKGKRAFKDLYDEPEAVGARKMANRVVIPVFEGELEDLKTLTIPPRDGQRVAAIYEAIEEMIQEVKADPLAQDFYPYTKAEKLAADYGLTACGHP